MFYKKSSIVEENSDNTYSNINVLSMFSFFRKFKLFLAFQAIYFSMLFNSYAMGIGVYSITKISSALGEIPTGIVSDMISRKYSVLLGVFLQIVSLLFYIVSYFYNDLAVVLIISGAIITGIGESFISGTNTSISYEALKGVHKENSYHNIHFKKVNTTAQFALFLSGVVGAFIAYRYGMQYTLFLAPIPYTIALLIGLNLRDTKHQKEMKGECSIRKMLLHFKHAIVVIFSKKKLRLIMLLDIISRSFDEAILYMQTIFMQLLMPVWLVGAFKGLIHLILAFSYFISGKIIDKIGFKRTIVEGNIFCYGLQIIAVIVNSVISPFFMLISYFFFAHKNTARETLLQHALSDEERSTMFSLKSMFISILCAIVMFFMGLVADLYSPLQAILFFIILRAILLIPTYINYFRDQE